MSSLQIQLNEASQQATHSVLLQKVLQESMQPSVCWTFSHLGSGSTPEETECLDCFVGKSEVEGFLLREVGGELSE